MPTTAEAGLPDFELGVWHGLYAPAGTPPEALDKLNEALQTAVADPTVAERFAELGTAPATAEEATPEALAKMLDRPDRPLEAADRGRRRQGPVRSGAAMQRAGIKDILSGLIFVGFGAAFGYAASGYPLGTAFRMGPGYFPLVLAGAARRSSASPSSSRASPPPPPTRRSARCRGAAPC